MKSKRDNELFYEFKLIIEGLISQSEKGDFDVIYFDESGFSLEPSIPYAWQEIGCQIEVPSSKSKRLNVLGFMDCSCELTSFVIEGSVTTEVVIASIDQFMKGRERPVSLILDNATVHTSQMFQKNIDRWEALGLTIIHIPPYSPELNRIEMLWRRIKYEWLPFSAYESFKNLKESLFDVLANIGETYTINFT